MTDKALEAALLSCPICDKSVTINNGLETGHFNYIEISCFHPAEEGPDGFDAGHSEFTVRADTVELAIAAWNRRAPLSALPGEAEVVAWRVPAWNTTYGQTGWQFLHRPDSGRELDADERAKFEGDMAEAIPLVTLASLQAMQARAEAAERQLSNMLQGVSDEES